MAGNENQEIIAAELTIQKALDTARNTEGEVDQIVTSYLERMLREVWNKLEAEPETYILTKDEFALFNFYRQRATSSSLAQSAIRRFWDNYTASNTISMVSYTEYEVWRRAAAVGSHLREYVSSFALRPSSTHVTAYILAFTMLFNRFELVPAQAFVPLQSAITQQNAILDVFQVATPVKIPTPASCTVQLMKYSFGFSYGKPYVGSYAPPSCEYNRVALTLSVTSSGRQFDRLAILYLNDTEIWRTSTAEPNANGIIWTYTKDVTNYLSLWKQPNKVVFDLGNLIDDRYTGRFNTTLTATFFHSEIKSSPADLILPISRMQSSVNQSSAFQLPQDGKASRTLDFPRNAKRATFTISAVGQAQEEFWWSNVPQSRIGTFGEELLPGFSPWREVQVLIDNRIAGLAWPFPVIFTGGVIPSFWRPVVGIDAFDMREDEIDITAWLPILSDGKEHTFEIKVVGLDDDGKDSVTISPVGNSWIVTGKIFLWLDQPGAVTTGVEPKVIALDPKFTLKQAVTQVDGKNASLSFKITGYREFSVEGNVVTSDGPKAASWKQNLTFQNSGSVDGQGNSQYNDQFTSGLDTSSSGYLRRFRYPLLMNSSGTIDEITRDIDIKGNFTRGKITLILGNSSIPSGIENYVDQLEPEVKGCLVNDTQKGEAMIKSAKNITKGNALTEQVFTFSSVNRDHDFLTSLIPPSDDDPSLMYSRHVLARNDRLTNDEEITREKSPPLPNLPGGMPNKVVPDYDSMQILDMNNVEIVLGRKYAYLFNISDPYSPKGMSTEMQQTLAMATINSGTRVQPHGFLVLLSALVLTLSAIFIS